MIEVYLYTHIIHQAMQRRLVRRKKRIWCVLNHLLRSWPNNTLLF